MDIFTKFITFTWIHPTFVLLTIPLALAWGIPISGSWKFIIFNLIACYVELIFLSEGDPYNFTFAFHSFFLITSKASHFRVVQKHEAFVKDAWEIEVTIWRYFGSKHDSTLQQHLARRLKARQISLRQKKYALARAATQGETTGEGVFPTVDTQEDIGERGKFARLRERCDRAFISTQTLSEPSVAATESEDTAAAATKKIDLDKRCGKEILRWLAKEIKESEGFVKPVKWSKDIKTGAVICHNGYTDGSIPLDFFANSEDLIIGSVSVLRPTEVEPALRLIETALDFIKFYDVNNFPGYETRRLPPSHVQFKRAVAVSCEFIRYPAEFIRGEVETLDVDDPNWEKHQYTDKKGGWRLKSNYVKKDRELVSLLTVSVDRYLVVTFHIAYMLKHCTEITSRELKRLFQDLILNKRKIKIWHNLPDGIAALDATLEHIFRGHEPAGEDEREHERYNASLRKPFREADQRDILRTPQYKDTGPDDFLKVNRPSDTEFRRGDISQYSCPLELHAPGTDYAGRHCPCDKGIIDITAIVDFILRQHRFIGLGDVKWRDLTSWVEPQDDYSSRDLVRWLLAGSKYQPILCRFKDVRHIKPKKPNTKGLLPETVEQFNNIYRIKHNIYKAEKEKFYATDGETKGIEKDDTCLSYVVGDAIGLSLILRTILTCETPALLAERLIHYAYKDPVEVESCAYDTALFRKPGAPISLPPLEQPNSFTIGLEADNPHTVKDKLTSIMERMSANPAWYLRQSTHGKIHNGLTFSHVIETAFIQTGWEYPRVPPRRPQARPLPGLRAGVTTVAAVKTAAAAAAAEAVAEETQSMIGTAIVTATAADRAVWANFSGEIATEVMKTLVSMMRLLNEGGVAGIEEVKVAVEGATRVVGKASDALKTMSQTTYGIRTAVIGLAARTERVAVPKSDGVVVSEPAQTVAGIMVTAGTIATLAETAETQAATVVVEIIEAKAALAAIIPAEVVGGLGPVGATVNEFRRLIEKLRRSIKKVETIQAASVAVSGAEIIARLRVVPAPSGTRQAQARQAAVRQAAAIAAATKLADTARLLWQAVNSEARTRAAIEGAVAIPEEASAAVEAARARVAAARGEVAVARAEVAPAVPVEELVAQTRVKLAIEELLAARAASTVAEKAAAEAAVAGATAGAAEARIAATAATVRLDKAIAERDAAKVALAAEVAAASAARRAAIVAETKAENETRDVCRELSKAAILKMKAAIRTRQFEVLEEIIYATATLVEEISNSVVVLVRELSIATAATAESAGDTEVVSLDATRKKAAEAALVPRLSSFGPDQLIPDNNYGLALTVRNLATKILRNNWRYMPAEFTPVLRPARGLSNGAWFQAFVNLLEWHCEVDSLLLPEEELMDICNPTPEDLSFQTEFGAQLRARVVHVEPVPALLAARTAADRAREKVELHEFADEVCAEILVFMLVKEISTFEKLDAARRLVLGIDKTVTEYGISAGFSMWDSVTIKHIKETFNLDSFIYQNPHWFKRLQVLLGHEFVDNIPMSSASSFIFRQCGAKDRAGLVEMLIVEVERYLKIYKYQDKLKDHFRKIVLGTQKHEKRNLLSSIKVKANRMAKEFKYPLDRREPLYKLNQYNKFHRPDLARPLIATPEVITEAKALQNAKEETDNWKLPEWCTFLLLKRDKSDYSGPTIERLFTPHATYPQPNVMRVHTPWLKAIIALLTLNPETGPECWDGIRKWWTSGLWIQGLGLADEHVDQALLPDLKLVTEDAPVPNPIPITEVQDRRTHNAINRAWIHRASSADREIEALAAASGAI